jgi:hypothetical protein
MSKEVSEAPTPVQPAAPVPIRLDQIVPKPVLLVCILFIVLGGIYLAMRQGLRESAAYNAIQNCDAVTLKQKDKDGKAVTHDDGLSEMYGLIQFKSNDAEIGRLFTYCETNPEIALSVYRRAMTQGTPSAKVIAAYSAFFIANRGVFEASDYALLRKCLDKSENIEVRKVAQRAISDLTIMKRVDAPGKYEEIPNMPPAGSEELARKVATHKESLNGQDVLYARWSTPDLADAWLTANTASGAWDMKLQRFVIP